MALEGTIRDFGLPDIFQLIGLQRKTGTLHLKRGKGEEVTIAFEAGRVVNADSSAKRLEARLGNVLVKQGKVSQERLDDALRVQRSTLQRLGHVLVTSGAITVKDLEEALHVQVSQTVFRVFRWRDGTYRFTPSETVEYERDAFKPLSADFILMEGIRMVDEWPIIEKKIPSMDVVFRGLVDPSLIDSMAAPAPEPTADRGRLIRLSPLEERVFGKIDGERSVQAIIDGIGLGEFEVCRTLADLLDRQIIEPVGRSEAPPTGAQVTGHPALAAAARSAAFFAAILVVALLAARSWQRPFFVSGLGALVTEPAKLWETGTLSRLERLDRAVVAYRLARGGLPTGLGDLVAARVLDASYLKDAQGRPFQYTPAAEGYTISAVDDAGRPDPRLGITRSTPY